MRINLFLYTFVSTSFLSIKIIDLKIELLNKIIKKFIANKYLIKRFCAFLREKKITHTINQF